MSWRSGLRSRAAALLVRSRVAAEVQEELGSHLAHRADDLERAGMSRAEAERQARIEFGGFEKFREQSHEAMGAHGLETLLWDARFGLRMLAKSRGFTAVALLTLTLGVGATTAVFSLIDALLLRPLPVPHASQLVWLASRSSPFKSDMFAFSAPEIRGLEKQSGVLRNVAAEYEDQLPVREHSRTVAVPGVLVSGQYFETLGVAPLLGRYLTPQDDREGGGPGGFAVVISESFWRDWFGRSPQVVGKSLTIANHVFTVVGVMPKPFIGADPTARPQIYAPLRAEPIVDAPVNLIAGGVNYHWLMAFARRNPGVSLARTNAALAAVSDAALRSGVTDAGWIQDALQHHFRFVATPGVKGIAGLSGFKKPLLVVFVLCVAMLLLGCLNLASLLLARATARERELATRLAVGASRARLMQQLLVESLLVAGAGSGLGVAASPMLSHFLAVMLVGTSSDRVVNTAPDWRMLAFSALTAILATLVIGLIPALRATSKELNEQIQNGSRSSLIRSRRGLILGPLMSLEVGLALILVVGAGLLATSLDLLYRTGLGFDPHGLVNLQLNMTQQPLKGEALRQWYRRYGEALGNLPGVKSVSYETVTPLSGAFMSTEIRSPGGKPAMLVENQVGPGYFRTMGIPLLEGHGFQWGDRMGESEAVVLNQKAADLLFQGKPAVGRQLYGWGKKTYVIGVVGNVRSAFIKEESQPAVYLPMPDDLSRGASYAAVLRVDGPLGPIATAARELAARMAPTIPAPVMTTMEQVLNNSIRSQRMMAMLSVFFAACALLITGIGLYGTLAYVTMQRTSEIGIRIALGAQRWQVVRLVLKENAWATAAGAVAGLGAAAAFARVLASFLYEVSATDPWVLAASALLLTVVASGASLAPAVRAAAVDPMEALRAE